MRAESEEKGGMKAVKEVTEEEDTTVLAEERGEGEEREERRETVAEGRGEKGTTETNEERRERNMTAVAKWGEEKGVKVVAEGREEMKTALLMMAARTLQRLLVGEAEERNHTRKRRALVKRKGLTSTHCEMIWLNIIFKCPGTPVLSVCSAYFVQ